MLLKFLLFRRPLTISSAKFFTIISGQKLIGNSEEMTQTERKRRRKSGGVHQSQRSSSSRSRSRSTSSKRTQSSSSSSRSATPTAERTTQSNDRDEGGRQASTANPTLSSSPSPLVYPSPLAISLSGCGFLCSYHLGAMICFQRHAQTLLSHVDFYCGASAGALVASLLVLAPNSLEDGLQQLYALAHEVNQRPFGALTPGFNMAQRLAQIVDNFLPADISPANGRLIISVTRQRDKSNRLVNWFANRAALIACLNATCYIPYYSSATPPVIDGEPYVDGVYSNNLPVPPGAHAITISPFSGGATIAPRDRASRFDWQMTLGQQKLNVNIPNVVRGAQSLFPQSIDQLTQLFRGGYTDAMAFLMRRGYYERPEQGTPV